ncbi:hypothetical protein CFE70_000154 [Pyrenophora teres f. teres 0-1]
MGDRHRCLQITLEHAGSTSGDPSLGNPGISFSPLPCQPTTQYATANKKPAFPGKNGGGVPPSPPRIANPASSNFQLSNAVK